MIIQYQGGPKDGESIRFGDEVLLPNTVYVPLAPVELVLDAAAAVKAWKPEPVPMPPMAMYRLNLGNPQRYEFVERGFCGIIRS